VPPEAYWRQAAGLAPHEFCHGTASPITNNPDHSIWLHEFAQMAGASKEKKEDDAALMARRGRRCVDQPASLEAHRQCEEQLGGVAGLG
jgi:hypothetical protein